MAQMYSRSLYGKIRREKRTTGQTALDDASRKAVASMRAITLPERAQALIPGVPVLISGGRAELGCDPKTLVPLDPRVYDTTYYVNGATGVDTNSGTTRAQAVKSIWKAIQLMNTAAVPATIKAAPGIYPRANGFSNNGAAVTPTQSCIVMGDGGQVVCHTGNALTWALDSGTTWSTARSNCKRVIDWLKNDARGIYNELALAASLAECKATPGTWYTDGTTLYVTRSDGAAVTDANTLALLTAVSGIVCTNNGSMHLYNITQMGGTNGCIQIQNNPTGRLYGQDCTFLFSTNSAYVDNVVSFDMDLVVLNLCVSAKSQKDGFNFHTGGAVVPKAILVDCKGFRNGTVVASTSNNGATIHDAGVLLDLNGRYFENFGGDFAHANAGTVAVGVCTQTWGSYGDIDRSGGVALPGTGFHSVLGADIYKFDCLGTDQITGAGTITQG